MDAEPQGAKYRVGMVIRRLREGRPAGHASIEATAWDAGLSSTDRLQRMEVRDDNLNKWLADLDRVAMLFGLTLPQLIERARVASP